MKAWSTSGYEALWHSGYDWFSSTKLINQNPSLMNTLDCFLSGKAVLGFKNVFFLFVIKLDYRDHLQHFQQKT